MAVPRSRERLLWCLFPLYSKIRKETTLDHVVRGQLIEIIRENPGLTVSQIKTQSSISRSTLLYHLSVLEGNGFITSKIWAGYRHFFPCGELLGEVPNHSTPASNRVWELIRANPGLTMKELAKMTDTTPQAVKVNLARLQLDNRVKWAKQGRHRRWFIED